MTYNNTRKTTNNNTHKTTNNNTHNSTNNNTHKTTNNTHKTTNNTHKTTNNNTRKTTTTIQHVQKVKHTQCRLRYNMGNYGTLGAATDDNIIRPMRDAY